jgi:hypothetical protein
MMLNEKFEGQKDRRTEGENLACRFLVARTFRMVKTKRKEWTTKPYKIWLLGACVAFARREGGGCMQHLCAERTHCVKCSSLI